MDWLEILREIQKFKDIWNLRYNAAYNAERFRNFVDRKKKKRQPMSGPPAAICVDS